MLPLLGFRTKRIPTLLWEMRIIMTSVNRAHLQLYITLRVGVCAWGVCLNLHHHLVNESHPGSQRLAGTEDVLSTFTLRTQSHICIPVMEKVRRWHLGFTTTMSTNSSLSIPTSSLPYHCSFLTAELHLPAIFLRTPLPIPLPPRKYRLGLPSFRVIVPCIFIDLVV